MTQRERERERRFNYIHVLFISDPSHTYRPPRRMAREIKNGRERKRERERERERE